jgi:hypothetical protein
MKPTAQAVKKTNDLRSMMRCAITFSFCDWLSTRDLVEKKCRLGEFATEIRSLLSCDMSVVICKSRGYVYEKERQTWSILPTTSQQVITW